jgi:hypothetical protein
MKRVLFLLIFILPFLSVITPISALQNNKFGIHISHTADINKAVELVNSNGGDWGYVTVVIQENDRNHDKWQDFFNQCREKHLIPLVRLAAEPVGEVWKIPTIESLVTWTVFLDSLNWPIKNRYIVIFNEPNHAKEWGNELNPKQYAQILNQAITVFKEKNPNFYILNAGLDQASPNSTTTMEEFKYLQEMSFEVPGIFNRLDGWASHSYPNHGYIGKPWETGKASVKGYEWELAVLKKNFGLTKDLPVFITETGWPHSLNTKYQILNTKYYNQTTTANYLTYAFQNVWLNDKRIVAITPFILNYPAEPFINFSWLDTLGNPYQQFETIKQLTKVAGQPEQIEKIEVIGISYPSFIPANNSFRGKITLKNTGQSIWGEKEFSLSSLTSLTFLTTLTLPKGILIKPSEKYTFEFTFQTPPTGGTYKFSWQNTSEYQVLVFDAWKLTNTNTTIFNRIVNRITTFWYSYIK